MGGKPGVVLRYALRPGEGNELPQDETSKTIRGWCAACNAPSEGNYSIHRDGFGIGPEVWLCDECGKDPTPTCDEIWARIVENREMWAEFERILKSGGNRNGNR